MAANEDLDGGLYFRMQQKELQTIVAIDAKDLIAMLRSLNSNIMATRQSIDILAQAINQIK